MKVRAVRGLLEAAGWLAIDLAARVVCRLSDHVPMDPRQDTLCERCRRPIRLLGGRWWLA